MNTKERRCIRYDAVPFFSIIEKFEEITVILKKQEEALWKEKNFFLDCGS